MHPDDEQIRQRAYEIWEREGRPEGREAEHWRKAAEELSAARPDSDAQDVPATRVRGPAKLDEPRGSDAPVPAAPSPDPESDPLELARPTDKAPPRKRNAARNGKGRSPDTAVPPGADTKTADRTR